jgi:PAS domain S-box-containing protein
VTSDSAHEEARQASAETALRENEEFRIAFDNAPVGMSIIRADGQYLEVNPTLCKMFGYTREELLAGTINQNTHPDDIARGNLWVKKMISGDYSEPEFEKRYFHKDGRIVWAVVRAQWVRNADGSPRLSVAHILDVTERKRAEQAQKMEAIGYLAGGIAHDFNNLLTAIGGNAALALREAPATGSIAESLTEIVSGVEAAAELTRQLLTFSRQQVIAPRVLNLNQVVGHLATILKRLLGEDLEFKTVLAAELGQVRLDIAQAEQILVNLAVNARDAMRDGGKLTIETANVQLDEEYCRHRGQLRAGPFVMLMVSDSGRGMTEATRQRLFEPFFTTKEQGHGTGLGLAIVYGAIQQNHGHIEVDSTLGRGTSFKIYLPRVDEPADDPRVKPAPPSGVGRETIVLVEDDDMVRAIAVRVLVLQGYRVHPFPDGVAALAAVRAMEERIDLLVTDVIMPGMNGRVLSERVKELRPAVKVLFTSGYTQNVIAQHGVLEAGIEFLAKPYSVDLLAGRVREVLG